MDGCEGWSFLWFFLCSHAQQVICDGIIIPYEVFGKEWTAKLPPTAFSDQIHSNSKKSKTKRKRMIGWIENWPKTICCNFLSVNSTPLKLKCALLTLSVSCVSPNLQSSSQTVTTTCEPKINSNLFFSVGLYGVSTRQEGAKIFGKILAPQEILVRRYRHQDLWEDPSTTGNSTAKILAPQEILVAQQACL